MKKVFLGVLLFTLVFNINIPFLYYKIFGFESVYYSVDEKYVNYAFVFLSVSIIVACLVLWLVKRDNRKIDFEEISYDAVEYSTIVGLFLCSLTINTCVSIWYGFSDIVSGGIEGELISYLQIFLDIRLLFFFSLVQAYKKEKALLVMAYSLIYTVVSLLQASRSALFWVVLFNLIFLYSARISPKMKRKISIVVVVACLMAPFAFIIATISRYGSGNSIAYYINLIIGRLSYLEIAGIELDKITNGTYLKDLFMEKYGLWNQTKQLINTVIPGNVFEFDVYPNQYWRAIFAGWHVEAIASHYTSMYMIMPLYLLPKYGFAGSVLVFVLIIIVLYTLIIRMQDKLFAFFMATYFLYVVLQFVDWTYHFRDLFCFVCTLISIKLITKVRKKLR